MNQVIPVIFKVHGGFAAMNLYLLLNIFQGASLPLTVSNVAKLEGKYRADLYELIKKYGLNTGDFSKDMY